MARFRIFVTANFSRQHSALSKNVQNDVERTILLLSDSGHHREIDVHKLHGRLQGMYSCSVNFKYRIVFEYLEANRVVLNGVGDHDVYKM